MHVQFLLINLRVVIGAFFICIAIILAGLAFAERRKGNIVAGEIRIKIASIFALVGISLICFQICMS